VIYDFQLDPGGRTISGGKPPGSDFLRWLLGEYFFSEVAEVHFELRGASPKWLTQIAKLTLRDTRVADSGLAHLKELTDLRKLTLADR
jgi:hypothetical protein